MAKENVINIEVNLKVDIEALLAMKPENREAFLNGIAMVLDAQQKLISLDQPLAKTDNTKVLCDCELRNRQWDGYGKCLTCGELARQSAWVKTEDELPQWSKNYLWRWKTATGEIKMIVHYFSVIQDREWFKDAYDAWHELPEPCTEEA